MAKFYYNRRFINGKVIIKRVAKIECLGGEKNMVDEIVFIDTNEIPSVLKGKTGRNWKAIVDSIPKGKSAIIPDSFGKGATVRQAIKKINEEIKKEKNIKTNTYKVLQRTEKGKDEKETIKVYVTRV